MSEVIQKIKELGISAEVPGNHHIYLNDFSSLWFLETGSVNLFAIDRIEGVAEGVRTFITTIKAPAPLFGFSVEDSQSYEIVAITEQNSKIWRLPLEKIKEEIDQDLSLVNQWILNLAHIYKNEVYQQRHSYIAPNHEIIVEKNEILKAKRAMTLHEKSEISWLQIESGELQFLNYPSLTIKEGYFPLTYSAFVKTVVPSKIFAHEKIKEWQEALHRFHNVLYIYVNERHQIDKAQSKQLVEKRLENEALDITHSMTNIVAVLNPQEQKGAHVNKTSLFRACQLVAKQLEIQLTPPETFKTDAPIVEQIKEIVEASSIRYRRVSLKERFWQKDCGPIIAFWGADSKPVALLQTKGGGYDIVDPETNERTPLNQKTAADLNPIGYYLFATFPDDLKTGNDLIKFYFKRFTKEYIPVILYSLAAAIISLFPPFATKILFSRAIPSADRLLIKEVGIFLIFAAISSSVFIFFRSLAVARIEGKSSNELQSALWDRLLKLPVSFFRKYPSGALILRAISFDRMRTLLSGNGARVLFSGVFSIIYIIAMAIYAPKLTLLVLIFFFLGGLLSAACFVLYTKKQLQFLELQTKVNSFVTQIVSSIGKLRVAGAEKNAFSNWAGQFASFEKVSLSAAHVHNVIGGLHYILPLVMYMMIFAYIIHWQPDFSLGSFLAFNVAFSSFYLGIVDLGTTFYNMAPIFFHWRSTKMLIEEPLEETVKQKPGNLSGEIHVDEVFFKYETQENYILKKVSLRANPREFIGIAGPSGSGKSTLIRLLLGFEKPVQGAVFFDNHNINSLSIQDVRRQLGVVLQEEGIIAGSIYENITCGGIYTPEQIENALKNSGLADDVENLPMGLHTYLSIGGGTLSGGQKQRILIARALLPNPKILILDEATSALDNRNQERVLSCIDQLDVTRIVIAHRLSTLKNADRIYVMDKGEFVQVGTYDELASKPGLFATMVKRQSL